MIPRRAQARSSSGLAAAGVHTKTRSTDRVGGEVVGAAQHRHAEDGAALEVRAVHLPGVALGEDVVEGDEPELAGVRGHARRRARRGGRTARRSARSSRRPLTRARRARRRRRAAPSTMTSGFTSIDTMSARPDGERRRARRAYRRPAHDRPAARRGTARGSRAAWRSSSISCGVARLERREPHGDVVEGLGEDRRRRRPGRRARTAGRGARRRAARGCPAPSARRRPRPARRRGGPRRVAQRRLPPRRGRAVDAEADEATFGLVGDAGAGQLHDDRGGEARGRGGRVGRGGGDASRGRPGRRGRPGGPASRARRGGGPSAGSDGPVAVAPVLVAQHPLQQLAGLGAGQLVPQLVLARAACSWRAGPRRRRAAPRGRWSRRAWAARRRGPARPTRRRGCRTPRRRASAGARRATASISAG